MRRRSLAAGAIFVVVGALLGWRANALNIRTGPPFGSVATTFDHPLSAGH